MATLIRNALENLRDYNYILPYAKAIEFAYIQSPLFKERPYFPKYFLPFKGMRERTYYYINDYHQYDLSMLEDDERKRALAIIYIFVVGIRPAEIEMIQNSAWAGSQQFDLLLRREPSFEMNLFPIREFAELGIKFNESYGYTYPIAFEEAMISYGIPVDTHETVAIFAANFSK